MPREGWDLAEKTLRDANRYAGAAGDRADAAFYMAWKPQELRQQVLRCLSAMVSHGELMTSRPKICALADVGVDGADIGAVSAKGLGLAVIDQRANPGYALTCPRREAKAFVRRCVKKTGRRCERSRKE